jgi:ParB-like chromosome segregation protein Spo0J
MTKLTDLVPDPKNRRKHTSRNVEMITEAIEKVGTGRSIVIDEDGVVLAGNATLQAATNAGLTKVTVVEAQGDEVIAVRRSGLTDTQKRELAIYDNRTAELAEWDVEQLSEDIEAGQDLGAFFEPAELDEIRTSAIPSEVLDLSSPPGSAGLAPPITTGLLSPSNVVMVQLFLTTDTQPQFKAWLTTLAKRYKTKTITDTVFCVIKDAVEDAT